MSGCARSASTSKFQRRRQAATDCPGTQCVLDTFTDLGFGAVVGRSGTRSRRFVNDADVSTPPGIIRYGPRGKC